MTHNVFFFLSYESNAWIRTLSPDTYVDSGYVASKSGYRMETTVNLAVRPDIGKINSSPETVIFPVEKYHRACTYRLRVTGKWF